LQTASRIKKAYNSQGVITITHFSLAASMFGDYQLYYIVAPIELADPSMDYA